jgi:mono/diheme cytochrome c family protein
MKTKLFFTGIMLLVFSFVSKAGEGAPDGKTIFMARCAACHNVNKQLTGPALAGVDSRRSIDWIVNFVHSSQTLVKQGDTTAVALFSKFNKVVMPDHPDLTEKDIKNIVEYVKAESKNVTTAPFNKPVSMKPVYKPIENLFYLLSYVLVVVGLAGSLYYAVRMKQFQLQKKAQ